jgi:hypothetical protein
MITMAHHGEYAYKKQSLLVSSFWPTIIIYSFFLWVNISPPLILFRVEPNCSSFILNMHIDLKNQR